jgi:hypothetical protein
MLKRPGLMGAEPLWETPVRLRPKIKTAQK